VRSKGGDLVLDISANNGWVLITALVAGAVGGLAAALIMLDPTQSQALPAGAKPSTIVAIRTLVGAVASAAFLFFFPVQQKTSVDVLGHVTTTATYSFLTVVALSLIVGTGGSAFLSAMRDKANSMIAATQAKQTTTTAKEVAKAALNAAPALASAIALQRASQVTERTQQLAGWHLDRIADQLPHSFRDLGTGNLAAVTEAITNATGDSFAVANPVEARAELAEEVAPIPSQLAADIRTAVQAHVDQAINQLNQLG
jgi:hypothetical protein